MILKSTRTSRLENTVQGSRRLIEKKRPSEKKKNEREFSTLDAIIYSQVRQPAIACG